MPPSLAALTLRWTATSAAVRRDALRSGWSGRLSFRRAPRHGLERICAEQKVAFLLTWGAAEFFLARAARGGRRSRRRSRSAMISLLILLSLLKYKVLWMTVDFVDLMIIDPDSIAFLFSIFPNLGWMTHPRHRLVACRAGAAVARSMFFGCRVSSAAAGAMPAAWSRLSACRSPCRRSRTRPSIGNNYVSHFARSGVEAVYEFGARGFMESDAHGCRPAAAASRRRRAIPPASRRTSSWCMTNRASTFAALPGVRVPRGYGQYFRSFDGKERNFVVEGAGGPSWYTEYNVLVRPFGALVWPLCVFRHPHCRRPGDARIAEGAAALRLSDLLALSGLRRLHEREELPDHDRRAAFRRSGRTRAPTVSSPTNSITTPPPR